MEASNASLWAESNPELVELIRDEIIRSGPIRFDRFMDLALYHDPLGYYQSPSPAPGRTGDFLTAPEAHPIFGALLAAQVVDFDALLGDPSPFTIIEYGAGSGRLIRPLLAEVRGRHPDLYDRVRYRPVEQNRHRMADLLDHLAAGDHAERVDVATARDAATGCAIANEFLDAFPVRRITKVDGSLHEAFVDWRNGWFAEVLCQTNDQVIADYVERHHFSLGNGDWVEFAPGIAGWVDELAKTLSRGYALIIDYGYPAQELFAGHRREGTLRAYHKHGVSNQFYRGVGRQDLTAHVNFSEVTHHAQRQGFRLPGTTTQADLLAALGVGERLSRLQQAPGVSAEDYFAVRAAVLRMIDPGAMGRFRVAIFERGSGSDQTPMGLSPVSRKFTPGS